MILALVKQKNGASWQRPGCNAGHLGLFILLDNGGADNNTLDLMKVNPKWNY